MRPLFPKVWLVIRIAVLLNSLLLRLAASIACA